MVISLVTTISVFSQLPNQFQKVELLQGLTNAVNFEFAPDGRIFIVDRYGELIIYNPITSQTKSAGIIPVFHDLEDGLLGVAFDPNFLSNNYVYIHYSPVGVSVNRVSRYTMVGDLLNQNSEVVLLEWPTQRDICCHAAGDLDFDSNGNLFIATGDNTQHSEYATLDETNSNFSSENTSSNTDDLRGKILRITPQLDGTYTIPSGNLFPGGTDGRPEIYVMGARNPYRIFVDKQNTDWLFWGEVGPDANSAGIEGPEGLDEINLTKAAGNFGWPYFSGANQAYRNDYSTEPFYYDPQNPINISAWNTGITNLPPAEPAWLSFFHECFLAGPRYYYDADIIDQQKLPIEFNEMFFYFDFNTSRIWTSKLDPGGNILSTERLAPAIFNTSKNGFIDVKVGPDGHLYILEYGEGCCADNVGTGKLVRVDYTGIVSNSSPVVVLDADVTNGSLPLTVTFSTTGTYDPDGDPLTYEWDFDGDGVIDSNLENPSNTYSTIGVFNVLLRVSDDQGASSTKNLTINAGNNAAAFNFIAPPDGGLIGWAEDITLEVSATDQEDGVIACTDINIVPSIGHLNHFHDDLTLDGCNKTITLDPLDHDIQGEMDIFYVLNANYTDQGGLTSFDQIKLHPKRKEAEFYDAQSSIIEINNTDPWGGGSSVIRVDNDSYIVFEGRNLSGISSVTYRVASGGSGGTIELRIDSPTGSMLASTSVPPTGGWNEWTDVSSNFTDPGGKHDLYLVFKNPGLSDLLNLNWVEFGGSGVSDDNAGPEVDQVTVEDENTLHITFSESLDPASAESIGSYQIDAGILVTTVTLLPDQRSVELTVTTISSGVNYILFINGVTDLSGNPTQPANYGFNLFDPIRINAGGPQVIAGSETFISDQFFGGGEVFENSVGINGTSYDALYQTERWGNFSYNIPVSSQGTYDIRIHFAEVYFGVEVSGGIGSRVFNMSIEGVQVLSNFDILKEVPVSTALFKEFNDVVVSDGVINIQFTSLVEDAKVSAIEILDPNTFDDTPDITILTPENGASVNQPFSIGFSVENWEVQEGSTHMHYFIDGVMIGPYYSLNPLTINGLSPGTHTIRIELFEPTHTGTGIYDEVTVNVTDQQVCGNTTFPVQWDEHLIDDALPYRSVYILPQQDIDGDGLKDIVTGGWWYKNPGSIDGNWQQNTIGSPFNNVAWIYDFDGDGDKDLFGSQGAYESPDLVWAENDGAGNFTVHTNIPSGTTNFGEIFIAGVAGGVFLTDGSYQLALAWNGAEDDNSQIQVLTVPADPVNTPWTIDNLHPTSLGEALTAGDIDGDGDLDLFQSENWLRNDQGSWTLFNTGITYTSHFDRNALADFDGDGDLDGVAGQLLNNREIAWFEAPDDPTQLWTKHTIHPSIDGSLSVGVADMDFDGDPDIIVGEWKGSHKLFGFENDLCNSGEWITHTLDGGGDGLDHHDGSQLVDIDDDGDLDIITIGWDQIIPRIFENLSDPVIVNLPPVIIAPSDQSFNIGDNVSIQLSGADPNPGDQLTYAAIGLPPDVNIDGTTGLISGQIAASVGDYDVSIRLTDQDGLFDEEMFTITITGTTNIPPELVNPGNFVLNTGPVNIQLSGSDQNPGDQVTFTATGLPSSLELDESSGLISGILTATPGEYSVTVRLTDQEGDFDEETFQITVTSLESLLRINSGGPAYSFNGLDWATDDHYLDGMVFETASAIVGTENDQLYQTERYADQGTMTYEIPLPNGAYQVFLHFAEIFHSGAGQRVFDVNVENGQGQLTDYDIFIAAGGGNTAITESFMVEITDGILTIHFTSSIEFAKISGIEIYGSGNVAPQLANPGTQQYNIDEEVNLQLEGSDLNSGDEISYTITGLPDGLTLNPITGLISGIIGGSIGDYEVTVRVTDQEGLFEEQQFTIIVNDLESILRINAGGPEFTFDGDLWNADQYFNGGDVFSTSSPILETTNDQLYQSERFADDGGLSYAIPLTAGQFQVRLHFSEIFYSSQGARIFSISMEGGQVRLNNYDIYQAAGAENTAVVESFMVNVTDGVLNIDFTNNVEFAKVSGIEINGIAQENNPPQITPIVAQTVAEGGSLEVQIVSSDPDGDIPSLMVDALPTFAAFTDHMNGTATLFLNPGFEDSGTYNVVVTATDNTLLTATQTVIIQVVEGNSTPSISPVSDITIEEGDMQTIPVSAEDEDGDQLTFEIIGNPLFVTLVDNMDGTAQLQVSPDYNQAGDYRFTIRATDPVGLFDEVSIKLTVQEGNGVPSLNVQNEVVVAEGSTAEITVTADDPDGDDVIISAIELPSFVILTDQPDGSAILTVSPEFNTVGSYDITLRATDQTGAFDEEVVTIQVTPITDAPDWEFTSEVINANCLNQNGAIELNVTGGFGEVSYSWSNGATTKDLEDLTAGEYTITVTDQKNNSTSRSFTVNVQPGPQKPGITVDDEGKLKTDEASSYQWLLDENVIDGAIDQTIEANLAGEYIVIITDEHGCITTSDPYEVGFDQSSLTFYPIPSQGELLMKVVLESNEVIALNLVDALGRVTPLGEFDLKAGKHTIELILDESLANGTYTILSSGRFFNEAYRILLIR